MKSRIGVGSTVLDWFQSYLTDWTQVVYLDGVSSKSHPLLYGVPQGSVAGPFTFIIYTGPLHSIAIHHEVSIDMYADDSQIYVEFDFLNQISADEARSKIEASVADICV